MRRALVFVLAMIGCNYDPSGQGSGSGPGTGSSSTGLEPGSTSSSTSVGSTSSESTTVALDSSGSSGSSSGTSEPSSTDSTTGEPPPTARSCAEILAEDPSAPTGIHAILRTSDDEVIDVWCEMMVDGGGWTLVGRSAPGLETSFGWGVPQGMLGDEDDPYSLDAVDVELPFTEILVGKREGFATLVEHAYAMEVPEGFLADYDNDSYQHTGARRVMGSCDPAGGPTMLRYVGHSDVDGWFYFRDDPDEDVYGLRSNQMFTLYDNCDQGGDINDQQGAVFVR